ncbi:TIGR03086 family metal-binding protein [Kutzneria albida]|uniref:Mycothiol-dependent maleylpyruvate isomerase metal-binding domain-containing protein n=1 Tax=Kutzneria albida DSM 43870 TaxID=1449976 RepID=W5WHH2_9PSEU|nr:TIGR03086 family metal-binding protein [Kutzneria albida]AHI00186.1 hypothetical protein KALB_6827 [Kutzneria albida DSM 43870]
MDVMDEFDLVAEQAQRVISAVGPEQFALPSPCAGWDVRRVVDHLVSGHLVFAAIVSEGPGPDRVADHLGERPAEAFGRAVGAFRAAATAPGALAGRYPTPIGPRPGEFLVHMRVNEMLAHGWDVAAATGQPTDLVPELAERALAMWQARLAEVGRPEGGPFAAERPAPPGATAADRLAAFLGREVPPTG